MTIRPAERQDAQPLLDFYLSLSDEVARVFLPPEPVTLDAVRAHLRGIVEGQCISLVLQDEDGVIMGHAFIQGVGGKDPRVGIGLRDVIIGCGYGRMMLQRLLELSDQRGLPVTKLSVVKTNRRAEELYVRMGYVRVGHSTFRQRNDSWLMERRLRQEGLPSDLNGSGER